MGTWEQRWKKNENEKKDKENQEKTMTKQAKIHRKIQSTKLDSYIEKKNDTTEKSSSPWGFKIRGVETTEIAPQRKRKKSIGENKKSMSLSQAPPRVRICELQPLME